MAERLRGRAYGFAESTKRRAHSTEVMPPSASYNDRNCPACMGKHRAHTCGKQQPGGPQKRPAAQGPGYAGFGGYQQQQAATGGYAVAAGGRLYNYTATAVMNQRHDFVGFPAVMEKILVQRPPDPHNAGQVQHAVFTWEEVVVVSSHLGQTGVRYADGETDSVRCDGHTEDKIWLRDPTRLLDQTVRGKAFIVCTPSVCLR